MVTASQAYERAASGRSTIGWKLDREKRTVLLQQFPPLFATVVADHVTLAARVSADSALPDEEAAEIIGRVDDGKGVEAMVVRLGGTTDRPDGSTYHITWSLGPGRRAKESNDVIRAHGWKAFEIPTPVQLAPARF